VGVVAAIFTIGRWVVGFGGAGVRRRGVRSADSATWGAVSCGVRWRFGHPGGGGEQRGISSVLRTSIDDHDAYIQSPSFRQRPVAATPAAARG